MNRSQAIKKVAKLSKLDIQQVAKVIDLYTTCIKQGLINGETVELHEFGKFEAEIIPSRTFWSNLNGGKYHQLERTVKIYFTAFESFIVDINETMIDRETPDVNINPEEYIQSLKSQLSGAGSLGFF